MSKRFTKGKMSVETFARQDRFILWLEGAPSGTDSEGVSDLLECLINVGVPLPTNEGLEIIYTDRIKAQDKIIDKQSIAINSMTRTINEMVDVIKRRT